jgi:hypothetical protein
LGRTFLQEIFIPGSNGILFLLLFLLLLFFVLGFELRVSYFG